MYTCTVCNELCAFGVYKVRSRGLKLVCVQCDGKLERLESMIAGMKDAEDVPAPLGVRGVTIMDRVFKDESVAQAYIDMVYGRMEFY